MSRDELQAFNDAIRINQEALGVYTTMANLSAKRYEVEACEMWSALALEKAKEIKKLEGMFLAENREI